MLNDPMWLNPKLLPELVTELEEAIAYMNDNKEGMFSRFKGFKDFEISKVQRLIDWIKSDTGFDKEKAMKDFYLFFSQHDARRETNFVNTFPMLENFWNDCEKIQRN
jgi:hypothetical protein